MLETTALSEPDGFCVSLLQHQLLTSVHFEKPLLNSPYFAKPPELHPVPMMIQTRYSINSPAWGSEKHTQKVNLISHQGRPAVLFRRVGGGLAEVRAGSVRVHQPMHVGRCHFRQQAPVQQTLLLNGKEKRDIC